MLALFKPNYLNLHFRILKMIEKNLDVKEI